METLQLHQILKNTEPSYLNHKYLIAVSGGVDSMVLLHTMSTLGLSIEVAHINYHLRGEASNLDQALVESFCQKHTIPLHIYDVKDEEIPRGHSIQNWARTLRYNFFSQLLQQRSLHKLLTAHHCFDNIETFIIHLSKASGLKGLCGIPKQNEQLLRPLLSFTKDELYDYAKRYNIPFREDASNEKDDYLRNRIRHHIVPELLKTNEHFIENFNTSISILNDAKDFIQEQIDSILGKISKVKDDELHLNKIELSQQHTFAQYEILSRYGFTNVNENLKLFTAETGRTFSNSIYQLLVNRDWFILKKATEKSSHQDKIELEGNENETLLNLSHLLPKNTPDFKWSFDRSKIKFPLCLRRKQEGDLFYPIGMQGKKKVSKFFKDEKLSILAKQNTWLLCDAEDTILGIIPFRQDRRYEATSLSNNHFHIINQKDNEV